MSILSESWFPPPRSWDAFEGLAYDVMSNYLTSARLQHFGRSGQAQYGVDIICEHHNTGFTGIQCKNYPGGNIKAKGIDAEIANAESFKPALSHYIIVTSADRDAPLTRYVLALSDERRIQGKFSVEIWFWQDICAALARFPDLVRMHYPNLIPVSASQPSPEIDVIFAHGKTHIELAADWERREARAWDLSQNVVRSAVMYDAPKWPGTVPLRFRIVNHAIVEAKDVQITISLPSGCRPVYLTALQALYPGEKERAIKHIEQTIQITLPGPLNRAPFDTDCIYAIFREPDRDYDILWTASAGNIPHVLQGMLSVRILEADSPPTREFPTT